MSHNITCRMNVSMAQLQNRVVQQILEKDFKWKILPAGKYTGWHGNQTVNADLRIALPQEQAPAYGEEISAAEAKQYGVPAGYKIIAVQDRPGVTKQKINEQGEAEEVTEGGGMDVIMDDHGTGQRKEVLRKIEESIGASIMITKAMGIIGELRADGTDVQVSEEQVRAQIAADIIANRPISLDFY